MEASHHTLKIFYCYAREDKAFRDELETHLFGLRRQQLITTWSDREIDPGVEWEKEIDTHLNTSHIIHLLVSPNFLASDYCYGIEMKRALERHETGDVRVVPIIIRPVHWQDAPFSKLPLLPTEARPVSRWQDRDDAWFDVVEGIREVIKDLQASLTEKENQIKKALVDEGTKLLNQMRYEEALTNFNRVIAFDNKYVWAITGRGETYRLMKRYKEALADFDRAITLNNQYAGVIASRGETYRLMERYEEALADFDHAIALDNKYTFAIAHRGETYRLMERYEEALADFDRAIDLSYKYEWAIASRGETYRLMGRYEEALADFDRAIALDDKYTFTIARRGETYRLMGQYKQTLADFNHTIALNGKDSRAITSRGETYRLMRQYEQALADFDRAIALDNKYALAIAFRGQTYYSMMKYEEALADFDRATALDDKVTWVIEINHLMKQYEEMLANLDRAIALDQEDIQAWHKYSSMHLFYFNMFNFSLKIKNSLDIALSQIQQNSENYKIAFNAALIQLVSGHFHDAEIRYADLISNCSSIYNIQIAAKALAEFLEILPKHQLAQKIYNQLQKRIDELK